VNHNEKRPGGGHQGAAIDRGRSGANGTSPDRDERSADPGRWVVRYAASGLAVLPLHSIRDGRCTCGRAGCHRPGKHPLTAGRWSR